MTEGHDSPLARARHDIGFTQQELATQAGVSRETVVHVEGGTTPSLRVALKLARVVGLDALDVSFFVDAELWQQARERVAFAHDTLRGRIDAELVSRGDDVLPDDLDELIHQALTAAHLDGRSLALHVHHDAANGHASTARTQAG